MKSDLVLHALVYCMDPRLQGPNQEKIAAAFDLIPGEYEGLTYPDPSLLFSNPHQPCHADTARWILEHVSVQAHHVKSIIMVGHSNCGGCAIKRGSLSFGEEKTAIIADLRRSARILAEQYPELEIRIGFVTIHDEKLIPGTYLPEIAIEEFALEAEPEMVK